MTVWLNFKQKEDALSNFSPLWLQGRGAGDGGNTDLKFNLYSASVKWDPPDLFLYRINCVTSKRRGWSIKKTRRGNFINKNIKTCLLTGLSPIYKCIRFFFLYDIFFFILILHFHWWFHIFPSVGGRWSYRSSRTGQLMNRFSEDFRIR